MRRSIPLWIACGLLACSARPPTERPRPRVALSGPDAALRVVRTTPAGPIVAAQVGGPAHLAGQAVTRAGGLVVAALDDALALRWATTWAATEWTDVSDLAVGPGGDLWVCGAFGGRLATPAGLVAADGSGDAFVARLGPDGATRWLRTFGGEGFDRAAGLMIDADGTARVVGAFYGRFTVDEVAFASAGASDGALWTLDPEGRAVAVVRLGGAGEDGLRDVVRRADGGVVVVGQLGGATDAGRWLPPDVDRSVHLGAAVLTPPGRQPLAFAAALAPDGAVRWATPVPSPGFGILKRALPWGAGWLVVGSLQPVAPPEGVHGLADGAPPLEGVVVTLGADGAVEAVHRPAGVASVHAALAVDGGAVLVGHATRGDLIVPWLGRIGRDGAPDGRTLCPSTGYGYGVAPGPDGDVWVVGLTEGGCGVEAGGFLGAFPPPPPPDLRAAGPRARVGP
ncbi:MAG: hypothetical protein H6704_07680 [Myxococcales bacterium]|nr:hypothetical protein [Myxococcales bacterium]